MDQGFRHEVKHVINSIDLLCIRSRLKVVAQTDPHARNGSYFIRSLYFDSLDDRALREKRSGTDPREKFRIRLYNMDPGFIRLEKKTRRGQLSRKDSALLTPREARAIAAGETDWMADCDRPLLRELYVKMRCQGLRPKTVVDYTREPYIYAPGDVRVTFDYDIRTGLHSTDFLDPACITVPAGDAPIILELKWGAFLPDIILDAVTGPTLRPEAFSKYAQSRLYG